MTGTADPIGCSLRSIDFSFNSVFNFWDPSDRTKTSGISLSRFTALLGLLTCLCVGTPAFAQVGFLESLWSDKKAAPEKKPATGEAQPARPPGPSEMDPPPRTTEARKDAAPALAPARKPDTGTAPTPQPAQPRKPAKKAAKASWSVNCRPRDAGGMSCSMVQNIVVAKTKQRLLTVTIQPQAKAGAYALVLFLPHGLYLPAGVRLEIDGKNSQKLVIQTCNAKGCYAGGPIAAKILGALKSGGMLKVSFAAANRKVINVPVSLAGFTAAFAQLAKAQ